MEHVRPAQCTVSMCAVASVRLAACDLLNAQERRMSENDGTLLAKQKELLMQRLADFESTNRTLRRMLRERHEQEAASLRLSEQRDLLLTKLSETEDTVQVRRRNLILKGTSSTGINTTFRFTVYICLWFCVSFQRQRKDILDRDRELLEMHRHIDAQKVLKALVST